MGDELLMQWYLDMRQGIMERIVRVERREAGMGHYGERH